MLHFDRRLLLNFDWAIILTVLVIAGMGLLNLYSATHSAEPYAAAFVRQLYFYLLGFAGIMVIISFDYRLFVTANYPLYITIILLLTIVLFFGNAVSDTQRWLNFGFFRLQPSEPAKLVLVITLASYYYRKDTGLGFTLKELVVPLLLTGLPFLLILRQPDLGTALMLIFIFISMTLFVKLKWSTLSVLIGACASMLPIGWLYLLKPYQKQRILTLFNPELDPMGSGYHILQSKIAIGSGMMFGKGFLKGTQVHLDFLPERHTDFAFSVWAEEWGFIGSLFFLACYFFLILMGLNIAVASRDKFGVLLAFGIVSLLFWQAFINLAMILGLLPVVGMPLPLFSYGGSSLLTTLAGIGILLNIRMRRFMTSTGD
ncbi:MAG: rod shape-determining protein RodA [Proteobacteria bacterium]|nr:rod shape-determining protein RodA [Pseudomonadota bacterium]MBU1716174.1 rod shape-determining protein RodA [Pseudomonadota bacterium]